MRELGSQRHHGPGSDFDSQALAGDRRDRRELCRTSRRVQHAKMPRIVRAAVCERALCRAGASPPYGPLVAVSLSWLPELQPWVGDRLMRARKAAPEGSARLIATVGRRVPRGLDPGRTGAKKS
jgi:hypothetical protein